MPFFSRRHEQHTLEKKADGLIQYFIALVPPQPVFDDALAFKHTFREEYNSKGALNSPPHITLHMPFKWKAAKETVLVSKLRDFASGFHSVPVIIDGFGSFPPRVIFMHVNKDGALTALQKALMRFCKMELNLFNADYRDLPFHPHITLAFRDLKKPMFEEAWSVFEQKKYSAAFSAECITLLRHDGKTWNIFENLSLKK